MNQVHRIAGGHYAHEITGDLHVVLTGVLLNDVKGVKHNTFGLLDPGAGRRAQPYAQQRSIGIRKQFGPHARQQHVEEPERRREINEHQGPAKPENQAQIAFVERAKMSEDSLVLFASMGLAHEPDRKSTRLNSSHLGISYAV